LKWEYSVGLKNQRKKEKRKIGFGSQEKTVQNKGRPEIFCYREKNSVKYSIISKKEFEKEKKEYVEVKKVIKSRNPKRNFGNRYPHQCLC